MPTVINTKSGFETAVSGYLQFSLDQGKYTARNDPTRVQFLRVSSFPFCARQWYLRLPSASSSAREESVSETWFLHVGTAVHDLAQNAMRHADYRVLKKVEADNGLRIKSPNGARLIANWVCPSCGQVHAFVPHPDACSHCRYAGVFTHREHRVSYAHVLRGHMDGTIALPPPDDPNAAYSKRWLHLPIDFKTCGADKVKSGTGLPYADNVEQLASYGAIKRHEGYNVPGTVLVYVSRDNPHNRRAIYTPLRAKEQLGKIDSWVSLFNQARAAKTINDAMKLPPVVTEEFAKHCQYCDARPICEAAARGDDKPLREASLRTVRFMNAPRRNADFPA